MRTVAAKDEKPTRRTAALSRPGFCFIVTIAETAEMASAQRAAGAIHEWPLPSKR